MISLDLKEILLDELGYAEGPGFKLSVPWSNKRPIPNIDSAYFVRDVPVVYFSHLTDSDPALLLELHRNVWNQSKVPLLYVVLPQEIRIYNGYAEPAKTPEELNNEHRLLQVLQQLTEVEAARQQIRLKLAEYNRLHLETGAFWSTSDGQRIYRESRADQRLLRAMDQVRRHLLNLDEKLSNYFAYALLGRSIFIRYLEDRDILSKSFMLALTNGRFDNYQDTLSDIESTYNLFERLSNRFNGDLFPVDPEEHKTVRQEHLNILHRFLRGDDLDLGQQSFWPYDFKYIPIELISGIYDTFINTEHRREFGAFYTPLSLVDFVLEETLPYEVIHSDMTILDPACGSGVFLVRAYQRLINAWQQRHNGTDVTAVQLSEILKSSIFGLDIKPEAIRITAFSLYLAMLDYLDKEQIREETFRFPTLHTNLFATDFFSPKVRDQLRGWKFDRVIGNPPWGKSTLKGQSELWVKEQDYPIGGKQIVQAFMWRVPEFCNKDGEIALLAPAKSTILVASEAHEKFRDRFFNQYHVRAVVNFSALVYELFPDALSPAIALFYRPELPTQQSKLAYGVPKPSPLSQRLGAIVLDATEVKFLDREELLTQPILWKVALWGTPSDAALIERLKALPTLEEQGDRLGWEKLEQGIQFDGRDKYSAPWLYDKRLTLTDKFRRYVLDPEAYEIIKRTIFHWPASPKIFRGPLVLIHQSPMDRRCAAAFSASDVVYRHKISGISGKPGQEALLKWLVAYINSPLAQYYHFLTSTSWAVERGTIIQEEYKHMPFLIPNEDDPRLKKVLYHFDQITTLYQQHDVLFRDDLEMTIQEHEVAIAKLVFDLYSLNPVEQQLVNDLVEYEIDFFYWAKRKRRKQGESRAIQRPNRQMLIEYAEAFIETVTALLRYQNQTLNAIVYHDSAPLSVVSFEVVSFGSAQEVSTIEDRGRLRNILRHLDQLLLEQRAPTLYTRRHVRIYDGLRLYLVRPSECRFWTRSQARADADSFITELLSRSSEDVGVTI